MQQGRTAVGGQTTCWMRLRETEGMNSIYNAIPLMHGYLYIKWVEPDENGRFLRQENDFFV